MSNNVYIDFDVRSLVITRSDRNRDPIPTGNQDFIFARFTFTRDWDGLNKQAIFTKDGHTEPPVAIVDRSAQIPNALMESPGTLHVSVAGINGGRRTVGSAAVNIVQSGFVSIDPPLPPPPKSIFVQSPDSTVPFIREYDGDFEYFAYGDWNKIQGGGGESGYDGWTPVFALAQDGERDVIRIINWTGGGGIKPATGYIGASGIVSNISYAVNIRGSQGDNGKDGKDGRDGIDGAPGRDGEDGDVGPRGVDGDPGPNLISSDTEVSGISAGKVLVAGNGVVTAIDDPTPIAQEANLNAAKSYTGLNYFFMGDSNVLSTLTQSGGPGWPVNFTNRLGIPKEKYVNYSVGGAYWTEWTDTVLDGNLSSGIFRNNVIANQATKLIKNKDSIPTPDVIMIAAGVNDVTDTAKDTMLEIRYLLDYYEKSWVPVPLESLDRRDLYASIRWSVETLKAAFPTAQIILISPVQTAQKGTSLPANAVRMRNVRQIIATSASKLGVKYIDGFSSGIIASMEPGRYLQSDGVHLTTLGAEVFSQYIYEGILYGGSPQLEPVAPAVAMSVTSGYFPIKGTVQSQISDIRDSIKTIVPTGIPMSIFSVRQWGEGSQTYTTTSLAYPDSTSIKFSGAMNSSNYAGIALPIPLANITGPINISFNLALNGQPSLSLVIYTPFLLLGTAVEGSNSFTITATQIQTWKTAGNTGVRMNLRANGSTIIEYKDVLLSNVFVTDNTPTGLYLSDYLKSIQYQVDALAQAVQALQ